MSSIRIVNQTPHYVRYGRTNVEKGEGWILFWREATCFEVTIDANKIKGTSYHDEFVKALERKERLVNPAGVDRSSIRYWPVNWEAFCDSVLRFILPKLEELAKDGYKGGRTWITLEDYLQTPCYKLSLRAPTPEEDAEDAIIQIDEGPSISPAFDMEPLPFNDLSIEIPNDLPRVKASEIRVIDRERDIRQDPSKVRMLDGNEAYLVLAKRPVRFEGGPPINESLVQMSAYFAFDKAIRESDLSEEEQAHFPRTLAVVTTSKTTDAKVEQDKNAEQNIDSQLAGLLVSFVPHARQLQDRRTLELLAFCKDSDAVVASLDHDLRRIRSRLFGQSPPIGHGGMNQFNVLIVAKPRTSWTDVEIQWYIAVPRYESRYKKDFDAIKQDAEDLEKLLGDEGWLRKEINKIREEKPGMMQLS